MQIVSNMMKDTLCKYTGSEPFLNTEFPWTNMFWKHEKMSHCHLEEYYTDKVSIIHCVIVPNKNMSSPIFGFDVIEIVGNLTGMFIDITPIDNRSFPMKKIGMPRDVPDWAHFFSDSFICCMPNSLIDVLDGTDVLKTYLRILDLDELTDTDYSNKHNEYMTNQRNNDKTLKMLSSHVGRDRAIYFVENILFPSMT